MSDISIKVPDGDYCLNCKFIDSIHKEAQGYMSDGTKMYSWCAECILFDTELNGRDFISIIKCSDCHDRSL